MEVNPLVVEELRALFRQGATPSRLMRHIVERHEEVQNCYGLIQAYFREAFAVDIIRGLTPLDHFQHNDLRYAFWNDHLLDEIVAKQSTWNQETSQMEGGNSCWFAGRTAKSIYEHLDEAAASEMREWGETWNRLNPKEQADNQRLVAGSNWKYEKVQILSRLAERLQQRVTELEGQLEKVSETAKG